MVAQGILLIAAGLWLAAQTVAGDLPGRLMSYAGIGAKAGGETDG